MNLNLLWAIFVRNFVSFFTSVTGYAFIFLSVLLSMGLTFGSDWIYDTNLANLDVLSLVYPLMMLALVPAITMGLWAGERRDGTDELLLTMPGSDFDIVLGKYLAAVAIYTVSLLFIAVPCYLILNQLASTGTRLALWPAVDFGLFVATFIGFWLMGLPAIGVGMVASFLTRNITLAWLLGSLLNIPLGILLGLVVLAMHLSGLFGNLMTLLAELNDSLTAPCRGTFSLFGTVYLLGIVVISLYLCMVLIGYRHWGRRGKIAMTIHYTLRTFALVVICMSVVVWARSGEVRLDVTEGRLTQLANATKDLLAHLETDRPVVIEAFISEEVPQDYIKTKKNLENTIREITALGHGDIESRIIPTDEDTEQAVTAEDTYGITPREVIDREGGTISVKKIFLGVRVHSGPNSITIPFFDRGIPVEYELIRSVCTVLKEKRKKIGVLTTDAQLYGQFDRRSMSAGRNWPVIDELEKQYEVVRVDASQPINVTDYDALLAVQPSTLGPQQMENFVAAVRAGLATAIFEDPAPLLAGTTGTSEPRRAPGGMNMMMMGQRPPAKGDITKLWQLLGVNFSDNEIIWQNYNPFPRVKQFDEQPEFVFIDKGALAEDDDQQPDDKNAKDKDADKKVADKDHVFNKNTPLSSSLQRVLFPFPGAIADLNVSTLDFEPLITTGTKTGTVGFDDLLQRTPFGPAGGLNPHRNQKVSGMTYVVAARIRGEVEPLADESTKSETGKDLPSGKSTKNKATEDQPAGKPSAPSMIDVVLVADIDMLAPAFFELRALGDNPQLDVHFDFDNVTFILNVLDSLAGDNRFIEIRNRRPKHRPLARIEEEMENTREATAKAEEKSYEKYQEAIREEQLKLEKRVREIEGKMRSENLDLMEISRRLQIVQEAGQKRLNAKIEQLERERDREIQRARIEEREKLSEIRSRYKILAWLVAPLPPLILGILVFIRRRARERTHVRQRKTAVQSHQK